MLDLNSVIADIRWKSFCIGIPPPLHHQSSYMISSSGQLRQDKTNTSHTCAHVTEIVRWTTHLHHNHLFAPSTWVQHLTRSSLSAASSSDKSITCIVNPNTISWVVSKYVFQLAMHSGNPRHPYWDHMKDGLELAWSLSEQEEAERRDLDRLPSYHKSLLSLATSWR